MRKIDKNPEPVELNNWKCRNPSSNYDDLELTEEGRRVRIELRLALAEEQLYLCAYCCKQISGSNSDTMNEHVEARSIAPNRSLDYGNVVASCKTPHQCDDSHRSQALPLTPLMDECEIELRFKINGRIEGLTDRALESIKVLNLGDHESNNKDLVQQRKLFFQNLLLINGLDRNEAELVDDEILEILKNDLDNTIEGKALPYAPVISKMLGEWL